MFRFKILAFVFLSLSGLIVSSCQSEKPSEEENIDYYTCPMHPQIHNHGPGQCPICGMNLVPVYKNQPQESGNTSGFYINPSTLDKAGVVITQAVKKEFYLTLEGFGQVGVSSAYPPIYDTSLIELNFTEVEAGLLSKDMEVEIENIQKQKVGKGKITLIKNFLDPGTRLVSVFVRLSEKSALNINSFVTGKIQLALGEQILVPKDSVLYEGNTYLVYSISDDKNTILPKSIVVGASDAENYVVTAGLNAGENIVKNGHFLLDAESKIRSLHD